MQSDKLITPFYSDEDKLKYFGKLDATLEERTEVFNELWDEFQNNHLHLAQLCSMPVADINNIRREIGPFNMIRKGSRLRFRTREDMTYVILKYSRNAQ